jgi:predicted transcriptional regulator
MSDLKHKYEMIMEDQNDITDALDSIADNLDPHNRYYLKEAIEQLYAFELLASDLLEENKRLLQLVERF